MRFYKARDLNFQEIFLLGLRQNVLQQLKIILDSEGLKMVA